MRDPKIGYTIGVWDLFHHGHRAMLLRCLERCDLLLVGVVDDYHVMMQKGLGRPVDPLSVRIDRVRRVSPSIRPVEARSLLLSQDLYDAIDVIYSGPDQLDRFWKVNNPAGKPVVVIPRTPGVSTTELIEGRCSTEAAETD